VQVAEFVQQADAQALVRALQMKGYTASLTRRVWNGDSPNSWAFFVKVGPFSDLKDAEAMRARLVADGYNPIMKRD
jgi:cell division septation protein DedD